MFVSHARLARYSMLPWKDARKWTQTYGYTVEWWRFQLLRLWTCAKKLANKQLTGRKRRWRDMALSGTRQKEKEARSSNSANLQRRRKGIAHCTLTWWRTHIHVHRSSFCRHARVDVTPALSLPFVLMHLHTVTVTFNTAGMSIASHETSAPCSPQYEPWLRPVLFMQLVRQLVCLHGQRENGFNGWMGGLICLNLSGKNGKHVLVPVCGMWGFADFSVCYIFANWMSRGFPLWLGPNKLPEVVLELVMAILDCFCNNQ